MDSAWAPTLKLRNELCLVDDGQNIRLAHQQIFTVADFDDFWGVAGEEDAVAFLDLHGAAGAVVEDLAGADGDDRAAGWLVFGCVGDVNAAGGLLLRFLALDDDFVAEWLERDFGFAWLRSGGGCGHV